MTAAARVQPQSRRPDAGLVSGWFLVAVVVVTALSRSGDQPWTVATYLLVWAVSTTVPGVLVWRVLGRPTSVVQELGFGSVLGIGLLLVAWLPATLLGRPWLMWAWPVAVAAAFAAVPSLRRHWSPDREERHRTPRSWHRAMIAVCGLAFLRLWAVSLRPQALPPHASTIFQDTWYELALTQQLGRGVAIDDPAVAGVPLHYHWFSNAHAAATQELSGASAAEVILHLWLVPMLFTFLFAVAAATERMLEGPPGTGSGADESETVRRWWAGPLAALLAAGLPVTLYLGLPRFPKIDNGFVASSTSGVLALTIVLALVGPVLDLLHGRQSRGTWVVVGLLLVLSSGSKPSILPVVACGSALVTVAQWVRTRTLPRVPAVLTLAPLLLIPLAGLAVVGSTGGSRPQLLDTLSLDPAFGRATGTPQALPGHGGWLAPGLADGSAHVWAVAAGLFLLYVLTELPRVLGLLALGHGTLRADPGLWWCSGVVFSGFCGLWLLAHPGYSQHYFWRIVLGLATALTVTGVVRLLPPAAGPAELRPQLRRFAVAGLVTGLVLLAADLRTFDSVAGRLLPYAVAAAVFAGLLAHARRSPGHPHPVSWLVFATCFSVAVAVPTTAGEVAAAVGPALIGVPAPSQPAERGVTGGEQRAALWLYAHSDPEDVVATNVFCAPPTYQPGCRHVSFWVAALTGRQLWVGAWAYTETSLSRYAHQNGSYQRTPSPWPGRVALSLRAVRSPDSAVVARLRQHGVRWIFADRLATPVSPDLRRYAELLYTNADVGVYKLG